MADNLTMHWLLSLAMLLGMTPTPSLQPPQMFAQEDGKFIGFNCGLFWSVASTDEIKKGDMLLVMVREGHPQGHI